MSIAQIHSPRVGQDGELKRLRELVSHNSDWIWEVDAEGCYVFSSPVGTELLGYAQSEILGRSALDFLLPEDAVRLTRIFSVKGRDRQRYTGLINRNRRADGSVIVLESSGVPVFTEEGVFTGYRGINRDVTALWTRLTQRESIYAAAPVPLFVVDKDLRFVAASAAMAQLCQASVEDLVGRKLRNYLPEEAVDTLSHLFSVLMTGGKVHLQEIVLGGRYYQVSLSLLHDLVGNVSGQSVAMIDITERKTSEAALEEARKRIEQFAERDYLTGLINRGRFDEILIRETRRALQEQQTLAIIMADVDWFKKYNDHYGHLAGDECLRSLASVLRDVAGRAGDVAARYGGEEFVVILPNTDAAAAHVIAEAMCAEVASRRLVHEGSPLGFVTMSFGVATLASFATATDEEKPWWSLVKNADAALYVAKAAGRNRVQS